MANFLDAISRSLTASSQPQPRGKRLSMESLIRASAKVDTLDSKRNGDNTQSSGSASATRGWQQQAWAYYDEVGELHYTMSFVGACLSRCLLTVGLPDGSGHVGPAFDEDGKSVEGAPDAEEALQLVQALRSDIGGQPQLLRSMGQNLGVAGEFHLVGSRYEGTQTAIEDVENLQWEVLSTDEFRPMGNGNYKRYDRPGDTGREINGDDVHVVRIWRSHPRFSDLPDSSVRSVMDILEELVLLTREVRGQTLSRLFNGKILLVPEEIEYPDDENDDAESDAGDAFTRDLINTFATAISDKGSAAQTVPFVVRGPGDELHPDRFRTLDLSPTNSTDSAAKRAEAVQRFAQGIDLPVEIVTGHANTTFANAVQIDDSLFKSHIEPILEIICDALTAGYLRPAMGRDTNLVVHYDSSELVARPNRAQDAKDGYDRFELSGASLRGATGFSDSDAPDDDEITRRIQIKQLTQVRQSVPTTPAGVAAEDQNIGQLPNGMPAAPGAPINQGNLTDGNNTDGTLAASISAAAEVSVERAVRRAGARLRSKTAKAPQIRDTLSQVPDAEVAITLGPALIKQLTQDDDLFHGEFDTLWSLVTRWSGDQNYADTLRDACEEIAKERLYQPRRPFPLARLPQYGEPVLR